MDFGSSDWPKLYRAFKSDNSVTFAMSPAIDSAHDENCADEGSCDLERIAVCGFNLTDVGGQVSFLQCMDDTKKNDPLAVAKACSGATISYDAVESCYNGNAGYTLLAAAAKQWVASGANSMPTVFVDGKNIDSFYDEIKDAICSAGSTAAVCKEPAKPSKASHQFSAIDHTVEYV